MESKNKKALTGGVSSAEALRQINPDVMAVYPITPQTPIIEAYSKYKADGKVDTEIVQVESEHSAISACVGSSAAGARTVTATSSQGLALMNEILYIASGMRLPILMVVSARALSAPINIHGDHSDVMGARDTGWIQIFSENPQEVYDNTLIGLRLAEKTEFPIMVIMDGFNTSHTVSNLEVLGDAEVRKFVGKYSSKNQLLDQKIPKTYGFLALQNSYFEFKEAQEEDFLKVVAEYKNICTEFVKASGRKYDYFEDYKLKDAEKVIVIAGSAAGTAKEAVDKLRKEGQKVGLLKIKLFRPFPIEEISKALEGVKKIAVLDRAISPGTTPPIYQEIINAIHNTKDQIQATSYVYGLGGRDIFQKDIENVFADLDKSNKGKIKYIGTI